MGCWLRCIQKMLLLCTKMSTLYSNFNISKEWPSSSHIQSVKVVKRHQAIQSTTYLGVFLVSSLLFTTAFLSFSLPLLLCVLKTDQNYSVSSTHPGHFWKLFSHVNISLMAWVYPNLGGIFLNQPWIKMSLFSIGLEYQPWISALNIGLTVL